MLPKPVFICLGSCLWGSHPGDPAQLPHPPGGSRGRPEPPASLLPRDSYAPGLGGGGGGGAGQQLLQYQGDLRIDNHLDKFWQILPWIAASIGTEVYRTGTTAGLGYL